MFTYGILGSIVFRHTGKSTNGLYSIPYRTGPSIGWVVSGTYAMMIASGKFIEDGLFSFNTAFSFTGSDMFSLRIDEVYVTS